MFKVNKKYAPKVEQVPSKKEPDMEEMHSHFSEMLKNALDEHYEKLVKYAEEEDLKEKENEKEDEEEKVLKNWEFVVERDPVTMLITKINAKAV